MPRNVRTLLFSIATIALLPSVLQAATTSCVGTLTGTYHNVVVPPGADCLIMGSTVLGNVKALAASRLVIRDSRVRGHITGDHAGLVNIYFTTIGGNVTLSDMTISPPPAPPQGVTCILETMPVGSPCEVMLFQAPVKGTVRIQRVFGTVDVETPIHRDLIVEDTFVTPEEFLFIQNSRVGRRIEVLRTQGQGEKIVINNSAGKLIRCLGNSAPFVSAGNVAPQKIGQCF
jgi:hypothetical protein